MRLFHHLTVLVMSAMTLVATAGGCSHIKEGIDCDEMCTHLQECVDGDLDIDRCANRCAGEVHDTPLRDTLDACTDCLEDGSYACGEVSDRCPVCDEVSLMLLD
jgi:hypothetical protein